MLVRRDQAASCDSPAAMSSQHRPHCWPGTTNGILADRIARNGHLTARDVAEAAVSGDTASVDIINRAGTLTGKALANFVNTFNPAQILIGGSTAAAGRILLDSIKHAVYQRAIADATRHLEIRYSPLSDIFRTVGAAFTAIDQLLSRDILSIWSPHGSPIGLATEIHAPSRTVVPYPNSTSTRRKP